MKRFKTLKDHVYDHIEEQIRSGSLRPNQRINEAALCNELGISRTPVREALIQLAAEGILENNTRKGFALKEVDKCNVEELYSVIGILDGHAARLACPALTEKDLSDMAFYVDAMELAIQSGNYQMYDKHQVIFHQFYIDKCGNSALIDVLEKAKNKLLNRTYIRDPEGKLEEILRTTNEEHRKILEFFREKDGKKLFEYLSEVHWRPAYAPYEIVL